MTSSPKRNRKQTEAEILNAVARVLARDSFTNLGINAVAREANVDKVLIYRYFGGMPQLLQAFGASGEFWPSVEELFDDINLAALPLEQRLQIFIERVIDALRMRPLTLEILAMEMGSPNELTDILNITLEEWGHEIAKKLVADYKEDKDIERLNVIMAVLFSGIQYLLLRARNTTTFASIPIQEDAGWDSIKKNLNWLCTKLVN